MEAHGNVSYVRIAYTRNLELTKNEHYEETILPKKEKEKESLLISFCFATLRCRLILLAVVPKELCSLTTNVRMNCLKREKKSSNLID